jgi:hypothetical protein
MTVTFDDFDNAEFDDAIKERPLWALPDLNDEEELLKWVNDDYMNKERRAWTRNRTYRENLCYYKGIHYKSQHSRDLQFIQDKKTDRQPRIVINHIYEMVETRVSKLTRFRPNINVSPANDEHNDKQNARTIKDLISTSWYVNDIDTTFRELERSTDIFGDSYLHVFWDKEAGDELPEVKRLAKKNVVSITNEQGEKIKVPRRSLMTGDVGYKIYAPDRIMPEKKQYWRQVDHLTLVEYEHIDDLKSQYPDKEAELKINNERHYDLQSLDYQETNRNEIMCLTIFHRATKHFPNGKIIRCTKDAILEVIDLTEEFPHGELPFIRQSDIDVPTELYGRSFIQIVMQAQRHFNNLASGVARNHGIASAPKWVAPKGAVNVSHLVNDITMLEFKGPVAPQLVSYNPTGREVFMYMDKLETYIQKGSGIQGVSRGEPPAGITSGVALQFMDEQENERANSRISKRNSVIVKTAQHAASVMGKHYKKDQGRMIKVLGKDGEFKSKSFDGANFNTPYDIRIQKASFLPESKASRTQTIIDLKGAFPELMDNEMTLDLLDLAQDQKYKDMATVKR